MNHKVGILNGVLTNKCPHCFNGKVFKSFIVMNQRCPECEYSFLKEEGYYLGSMIAAYFMSAFTAIPVFVMGSFIYHLEISILIGIASVQVIVLSPILYRFATIVWLWIETTLDQKLK